MVESLLSTSIPCSPDILQESVNDLSFSSAFSAAPGALLLAAPVCVTTGATKSQALLLPSAMWDCSQVLTGTAAVDWLTLTTFNTTAYVWVVRAIEACTDAVKRTEGKQLQYRGLTGEGYFFGEGFQAEQPAVTAIRGKVQTVPAPARKHYLVRLSGSLANHVYGRLLADESGRRALAQFKCTRIDVQYTHHEPLPGLDLAELPPILRTCEWTNHKGRRPKIDLYNAEDGLHTLYIGARKESNRFQRVYVKPVQDARLLRWEVEYKQELAELLGRKVIEHGLDILPSILAGELSVVPLPDAFTPLVLAVGGSPERLKICREATTDDKTLEWLWRQVAPALKRLTASTTPKVREAAKDFLEQSYLGEEVPRYPGARVDVGRWLPDIYQP